MPFIKILTWNTRGRLTKKQTSFLLNQIGQHNFDIVALQETPARGAVDLVKGTSSNYQSIWVPHTLPTLPADQPLETIEFLGVRGSTSVNEDDSYLIMANKKSILVVTHFMPKYMTIPAIEQTLSPVTMTTRTRKTRKRPEQSLMDQLAMRRPYYVKFKKSRKDVHFMCWHAPEGGSKRAALPAIRLLNRTAFKFIPNRRTGQNIIIAGDLNAKYIDVITTLAGDRRQWSNWKNISATWDHILAYGVNKISKLQFTEKWTGSDHPPVAALITL